MFDRSDILVKNRNFLWKIESWSKIKILLKNRNIGQNRNFGLKNQNFGQKEKTWSKIEILVKNRNFGQKWENLVKNLIFGKKFGQKEKTWSKIEILLKNQKFGMNSIKIFKWKNDTNEPVLFRMFFWILWTRQLPRIG